MGKAPEPTGPTIELAIGASPRAIADATGINSRDVTRKTRELGINAGLDAMLEESTAEKIAGALGWSIKWIVPADPEPEPEPEPVKPVAKAPKAKAKPAYKKPSGPIIVDGIEVKENELLIPTWRPKSERPIPSSDDEDKPEAAAAAPRQQVQKEDSRQKPSKRGRGGKGKSKPVEEQPETPVVVMELPDDIREDELLPVMAWRKKGDDQPSEERPKKENRPPREREERRQPKERRSQEPAAQKEPPAPKVQIPEPVKRERISVPVDAPQVVLRNGLASLVRDRKVIPPVFFFASALDEKHLANVLEEVKMSAENGIHVYSLLTELEVRENGAADAVKFTNYIAEKITEVDSDAQFILRTVFVAPNDWSKNYPKAVYKQADGQLAEPSFCDDAFWGEAEKCLTSLIEGMKAATSGSRLLGVHLERGEWFLGSNSGYDKSTAAVDKFQSWLRHRYGNDPVSLRAAWFDGSVTFESAGVPDFNAIKSGEGDFVRTDRRSRRWIDYHLFLSDVIVERITDLAYASKKAANGSLLVGASYGYSFEWSHPGSGHLSLGKLLRSPDIDYVAGPPSYKNREPGGSAPFPFPVDSFALNGKLALSEEDFKTPISGRPEPDDFNPVMKTPQALESVHWRGAGSALAHGSGVCWMDTWGNGWLNSRGIWERAKKVKTALMWRLGAETKDPDVAMFIDERSLAYLVDERAFGVLVQNVRESILRAGLSVGFYLLSDLAHRENFPEAKLHVFVNAWDIRPEVRSAIKTRLQKDNKVLFWLYCAGLFEGGRESLERAREATGIALRPQPFNSKPGTTLLNMRDPLCRVLPEGRMAEGGQLEPSYFAIPEDAAVLGEYSQTGLPSFVVRKFPTPGTTDEPWTSVFLGEPVVTPGLFRSLGAMAGCHIWNHDDDVIHARPPFLTIHCTGAGQRTVTLPDKWSAYDIVRGEWMAVENCSMKFIAMDGASHSFLVGHRAEIQEILNSNPDVEMLESEVLAHQDNTVHWDSIKFDVPIMKLDEWVEETWSEELADDLLLKPSMMEVEADGEEEEQEAPSRSRGGRRFKRNRGRKDNAQKPDPGAAKHQESGISFLFRKRE